MLSSVYLSGRLGQIIAPKVRYVELDRLVPGSSGRYEIDKIPVKSMLCMDGPFMKCPSGTQVIIKGRLEVDPHLGLVIIDEMDEIFRLDTNVKKI